MEDEVKGNQMCVGCGNCNNKEMGNLGGIIICYHCNYSWEDGVTDYSDCEEEDEDFWD